MFDANTTIHTEPQIVLHKTYNTTQFHYMYVCVFDFVSFFSFSLVVLKRNITYRNTVVHKKSNASFLFFLFHVSKRQDRHFIVSQNASTSEPCFTVSHQSSVRSIIFSFFFVPQDTLKTVTLDLQRRTHVMRTNFALGKMFLSTNNK